MRSALLCMRKLLRIDYQPLAKLGGLRVSLCMQLKSQKTRCKKGAEASDANAIWLTPRQLCKRWNVTDFTLRRWREQGKLKATAFSTRTIRFSISEIERFENSK